MTEEQRLLSDLVRQFIESVTADPRLNRITASGSVSIGCAMESGYDYHQRYKIDISLSVNDNDMSELFGLVKTVSESEDGG
jgi:hypothetical protein